MLDLFKKKNLIVNILKITKEAKRQKCYSSCGVFSLFSISVLQFLPPSPAIVRSPRLAPIRDRSASAEFINNMDPQEGRVVDTWGELVNPHDVALSR